MFDIREAATDIARFLSFATDIKREAVLYEQMFCYEQSVEVANTTFPDSLSVIRRCVFVSVLTRLSAMFDPPRSGDRDNFSFAFLKEKYGEYFDSELLENASHIEERLSHLQVKSFRNKLIAHHDHKAVIGDEDFVHNIEQGDLPELLDSVIDLFRAVIDTMPDRETITMSSKRKIEFTESDNGIQLMSALARSQ